ncbi:MAG: signal peptidase I [Bacteroidota bacterium]
MSVLIFFLVTYLLTCFTLQKLFEKAGSDPKKAWIPGPNFVEWCKIVGRSPSHAWWMLFPIVNFFIWAGLCVDMVRSFGKHSFGWAAISVIFAPYAFWRLGNDKKAKYVGPVLEMEKKYFSDIQTAMEKGDQYKLKKLQAKNPYKKSAGREWVEAIVFAVFAAAFIRMFLIEAYVIPTPSMEGSLLVGDFMFVSKAHYGIRTPMTVAMIPLLHNTIPYLNTESYLKSPSLGYHRLPAISSIKNNDPIVFNYPEGDSVYVTPGRIFSIHDHRKPTYSQRIKASGAKLRIRPIDKRDHYIKRCIGIPGDKLEIKDRQVYINDKELENSDNIQFEYTVTGVGDLAYKDWKKLDEIGVASRVIDGDGAPVVDAVPIANKKYRMHLGQAQMDKIKSWFPDAKFEPVIAQPDPRNKDNSVFPHDARYFGDWTVDNYGPIVIPKEGATVPLKKETIALYRRIINTYEGNTLKETKDGKFIINGEAATEYTFKQDYYWGMGDNRHASEDCRYFGFIPENHIVGKPLFIWFSTKNGNMWKGINWGRIFSGAYKM